MKEVSRRALIAGACGVAIAAIPGLPAEAASAVKKLSNGKLSVRVRDIPALKKVGGSIKIGDIKGQPVALARTGTSSYVAFSLLCPHQGVTVTKTSEGWACFSHGSKFEPNGDLNFGPATTGLPSIPIKVTRGVAVVG